MMAFVIARDFFGIREGDPIETMKSVTAQMNLLGQLVGRAEELGPFLREVSVTINEGVADASAERLGTFVYKDKSGRVMRVEHGEWHKPEWMTKMPRGRREVWLEDATKWTSRVGTAIQVAGGAGRLLISLQGDVSERGARGLQGVLDIAAAFSPPGVDDYLSVLSGAIDAGFAAGEQLSEQLATLNAIGIINDGLWYTDFGTSRVPFSKPWFAERSWILRHAFSRPDAPKTLRWMLWRDCR